MSAKKSLPLEVTVTISLGENKFYSKGDILKFSPETNDDDFGFFFSGYSERNLVLFSSGARQVFYNGDANAKYVKTSDSADFDGEFQTPIRRFIYQLRQ